MKIYIWNLIAFCNLLLLLKVSCNDKRAMSVFEKLLKTKYEMRKRAESRLKYAKAVETFLDQIKHRQSDLNNIPDRRSKIPLGKAGYLYGENFDDYDLSPSSYGEEFQEETDRDRYIQHHDPENKLVRDNMHEKLEFPIENSQITTDQKNNMDITGDPGKTYNFRYDVSLDSKGDFRLFWDIDIPTEVIYFRLEARVRKTDFLAFGFSDYGEASRADFAVMWTNWKGKHMFQDMHTNDQGVLGLDDSQDYILDDVIVRDGNIDLLFHRKFDTCDNEDYMIDGGTTHVIFFSELGVQQKIEGFDVTDIAIGLQRVQLIKSQLPDPPLPEDTFEFVMHVDNVEIPGVETTYWFATRKLPELPDKHHIIRFEGVISPGSVGIVHHMEVFHCDVPAGQRIPDFDAPSGSNEGRPKGLEACRQVIGAWAMGAQPLSHPEEAGVPIGGPGFSSYVMVEVHYNNPDRKKGVIDSSGIKFYVTRQLRQYDAGIMEIGLEYTDKMALPPRLPAWDLTGYCISECTQVGLPEGGIKVFASQLHTHLTGRKTFTMHYRDGVQLPDLNRDNHYSPHYQEIRKLPRPVTVLPGDALVHVCRDRTSDRENVTLGGFAISDEMCVNYMHYYPKTNLEVCKSSVTTPSLYGFFNFMHKYNGQNTSSDLPVSTNYKTIDWSPMNIHLLQRYYSSAPLSMQCNQSDGTRFPGDWEDKAVPKLLYPSPPTERPCLL